MTTRLIAAGIVFVSSLASSAMFEIVSMPGVGDHPDRDREEEVLPRRRHPEVDVVDQHLGEKTRNEPDEHEQQLREEVDDRQQRR